ncbi:tetratricopeptide repeat-containing sulfotransferase family protein [Taklimakanibacter deserti]|uniref:tetratricopeptide repeat-containing sulfotransferase family protein n=1 Tax=Taklimakanibacter deserti TaxID=2267839 RepID=UPI0013C3F92C
MKMKLGSQFSYKRPDPVVAEIRRIGSLMERNDLAAAETEALKLLKANPRRPDVHNILGVAYVRQDKNRLAVPHFEFAVKAEPENAHYLNNLGRLYIDLHLIELALPFLHKALAIKPDLSAALLAIGKYYNEVGKAEKALPYLERLHKIMPGDSDVKRELAESLDAHGKGDAASVLYQELRQSRSNNRIGSYYYFSRNPPPEGDAAITAEIEQLLANDKLKEEGRSRLHTALGFIHERARNYPLAFSHFDQANRLSTGSFDIGKYRAWVDRLIEIVTPGFFRERSAVGNPSPLPVLVVGMPRSGTTLTEQIIASHGRAGGAGELLRIGLFVNRLDYGPRRDISKFMASLGALGDKGLREMGDNYVDLLKFHAPKAERVVDKLPHNFENLAFLALMCPEARIVHCSRNPVDTCWSCFQNPLNEAHGYSRNLTDLGLYYREYKRLMDHWKTVVPLRIYELNYEQLTADFENEARKLIDFIGLPWDDACLKFHEAGRTVRTFSRQQVRNPIYSSSVERWRRYETELAPLLTALGDLVQSKPQ